LSPPAVGHTSCTHDCRLPGCRATYANNKTKQYDEEATRYLSYALYPLVIGYAIYSLIYETHKSWWVRDIQRQLPPLQVA
jgi:hypothetical protein